MRERITFLQKSEHLVDPSSLEITHTNLKGPNAHAAREERVTLSLSELPTELQTLLRDVRELHIRWDSQSHTAAAEPLFSRLSPGLHVFYTPLKKQPGDEVCLFLKDAFSNDLDCVNPEVSFTALSDTHSKAFQYYQPLQDLSALIAYVSERICPRNSRCLNRAKRLSTARSFDLSWDITTQALKVTALWPDHKHALDVTGDTLRRVEVGILTPDSPATIEAHELGLSGHLVVLDGESKPSSTLFTFPSRHRHSDTTFSATFAKPTGLHPSLELHISSPMPPKGATKGSCKLHTYLTLPRQVFADKYQLGDDLFLASKNLAALKHMSQPVDLEAPDYAVKAWGSAVLLELQPPPADQASKPWSAEVPMHLRYLAPTSGGYRNVDVPCPVVFWACTADEGTKFTTNPFDKANLGYDALFDSRTVFWHVDPEPVDRLVNTIQVPVLDTDKSRWVNVATAVVVTAGFLWVMWKLVSVYLRLGYGPRAVQDIQVKEKKKQ